jgi:hypothetical protein
MPYQTIWEPAGVCQKYWGVVTSPELFDSLTDTHNDPRFDSIQYAIKDYLDVEVFDVGVKTLLDGHALNMVSKHTNPNVVVAVVTTNPQIIESSKSASSYRLDAYPRKIFPTMAEAREWIEEAKTQ